MSDVLFCVIKPVQIEKQQDFLSVCVCVSVTDELELQAEPVSTEQFSRLTHSYRQTMFAWSFSDKLRR